MTTTQSHHGDTMIATTVAGSRTFGGQFVVEWTPSSTSASLVIKVFGGGSLLDQKSFDPDNATQPMSGDNGTYAFKGTFIAAFNAPPTSGTLFGRDLSFKQAGGSSSTFSGTVGVW